MQRRRAGARATVAVALLAATVLLNIFAGSASAARSFQPRSGFALGMLPPAGRQEIATGTPIPVVYHDGPVMRDVTIHTVFWAPSGFRFDGSPAPGVAGYQQLIQQFFADVAHDSGTTSGAFSVLNQYGDHGGNGAYQLHYAPAVDSVLDTNPFPPASQQCPSPSGIATCITDLELQRELDRLIGPSDPGARGLSNIWFILLPPNVDTCTSVGSCGTNAYAGYHSAFQLGHGETIYAAIPDPLIEYTPPPGSDPQGNPEAESTVDTVAHELVEAVTDPVGTAWMDPNGFEVGDKCENGPQAGTPLGYAADGAPYNQVINGHQYLIQDMWSNSRNGCVQSSATVASTPTLHTARLRQFSARVSGDVGAARRVPVDVALVRAGVVVASASGQTRANGSWGPLTLRDAHGRRHAVGDDRDVLRILYGALPGSPPPDVIATGDGGNPFTASGWTGWFDLDHGYSVTSRGGVTRVLVGPCSQTGVLTLRLGPLSASPTNLCQTESDAAVITAHRVGAGRSLSLTSLDNRGSYLLQPDGTLVAMTVPLGEPNGVPAIGNAQVPFNPTGFPTCTAFVRIATVRCVGLVAKSGYRLVRGSVTVARARAGRSGAARFSGLRIAGGDVLTVLNAAGRRLTSLHVARLRVAITGNQTTITSGTCQPGDYWGKPQTAPAPSTAIGLGIAGSGTICPASGRAKGLPTTDIAQLDDFSGGETVLQVPVVESTAPIQDETLYGSFVASAQSGLPGPHGAVAAGGVPISLTITAAGSNHVAFSAANVDTARGVPVSGLAHGAYTARWVLRDRNGDTRTVTTRFDEA